MITRQIKIKECMTVLMQNQIEIDNSTIWNNTYRIKWIFHADKKFTPPNSSIS